jgi:hypothetical protein
MPIRPTRATTLRGISEPSSSNPQHLKRLATAILASLVLHAASGNASAQPYVGGSVLADIVRASGPDDQPGSGEAIGGSLRLGTSLADRWGIDLEFARSGDIEWRPDVTILAELTRTVPGLTGVLTEISIFPTPEIAVESQLSTLTTMLWWRQEVTDRFDLVYFGGAAFTRTETESRVSFSQFGVPGRVGVVLPPTRLFAQETVVYDTGVVVGIDAHVDMTDHLRLVPGLRMLTVTSRWIIRPSVGLQWRF